VWSIAVMAYLLVGTVLVFISWKKNQQKYSISNDAMPLMMILAALFWPLIISVSIIVSAGKKKFVIGNKDDDPGQGGQE
jgi:hypothetical protein